MRVLLININYNFFKNNLLNMVDLDNTDINKIKISIVWIKLTATTVVVIPLSLNSSHTYMYT